MKKNERSWGRYLRSLLSPFDPETLHELAIKALNLGFALPLREKVDDPALATRVFGQRFPNPIGIAAGFDKNAQVIRPLERLGFGFVEVGTVTLRPQSGNPRPRLFRLDEDRAIINRMGLNSRGLPAVVRNLKRYKKCVSKKHALLKPTGINIGLNRGTVSPVEDYFQLLKALKPYAHYFVFNVSCPNVEQPDFAQTLGFLRQIIDLIEKSFPEHPPILVKISPDLAEEDVVSLVKLARRSIIAGLIVANTTARRPSVLRSPYKAEKGGLSGAPLADGALQRLRFIARLAGGQLVLIASGGVFNGHDALERIRHGADLVEIYTSFVFRGPHCANAIKREMLEEMQQKSIETLDDIRGSAL